MAEKEIIQELAKEVDELKIQNRKYEMRIENLEELFERFAEYIEEIQDFLCTYGYYETNHIANKGQAR